MKSIKSLLLVFVLSFAVLAACNITVIEAPEEENTVMEELPPIAADAEEPVAEEPVEEPVEEEAESETVVVEEEDEEVAETEVEEESETTPETAE